MERPTPWDVGDRGAMAKWPRKICADRFTAAAWQIRNGLPPASEAKEKALPAGNGKRAGEGTRTLDNHVGNVVLYQLSYTRSRNTELQVRYSESGIMRYQLFASTSLLKNCTVENPGSPEDRVGINAENFIEFAAEEGKLA